MPSNVHRGVINGGVESLFAMVLGWTRDEVLNGQDRLENVR